MNVVRTLREWTDTVYVIRYREDISLQREALEREGFHVEVCDGPYSNEQLTYSPSIQCLVNHASAWKKIDTSGKTAIIVEPDFVPVRNFGGQFCPMPYDDDYSVVGMAWLYACGPILYGVDKYGFAHGHASSVAACLITPRSARSLLEFFQRAMEREHPGKYWPWDTQLGVFLRRERGMYNYIPTYHLGEHGSDSRSEHSENGMRKNWHQADVLAGSLSFLPKYAVGSPVRLLRYRLRAYAWGWLRLLTLRYFDPRHINRDTSRRRGALALFSILRLVKLAR
jgi:hypothetical protein